MPKVLDEILTRGGSYVVRDIRLGQRQADPSYVRLQIRADSPAALEDILHAIHDHGAVPTVAKDCEVEIADIDGAFPERFYSTTNYRTQVRFGGDVARRRPAGDGLRHPPRRQGEEGPLHPDGACQKGDAIVVGRSGLRVMPAEAAPRQSLFEFMSSAV